MDFERVAVLHVELREEEDVSRALIVRVCVRERVRTESGLSVGCTRWPSKRNRTLAMFFPWRSQKAFISLLSCVVRLILKKTSLLLSVTLMLRCSCWPSSGLGCMGDPLSDMLARVAIEMGGRGGEGAGVSVFLWRSGLSRAENSAVEVE